MTIPAAFLDELRARTTLSTIVQRSVKLTRAGREWKGCCPFHDEKTPSFYVNDQKQFYHCFGCNAHGDAISWMVDQQAFTFIDAVKDLATAAGMDVPAPDARAAEREQRRSDSTDIMERAAEFFTAQLHRDDRVAVDAMAYLLNRGITEDLIARFGIGFAPNSKMGDAPYMATIGAPAPDLEQLGLIKRNPDSGTAYDFFRRRIMIPIHDARGKVIAFGGRIVGQGEPKYLNSPDTPIFDKGRTLYNLHRAAPKARATNRLIIVEGYLDVIGLARVAIEEVVAPNGTALTEAQMALAWRLVDEPIICMDGDKAGRKAAVRAAVRALPDLTPGKGLSFVFPPDGKDPDDIAREGGSDGVNAMLLARRGIADVLWQDALEQMGDRSPERISRMRRDLRDLVGTIKDQDVRSAFGSDLRNRLDQMESRTTQLPRRFAAGRQAVNDAVQEALIKGILLHPGIVDTATEAVCRIQWLNPDHARLVEALLSIVDDHHPQPVTDWDAGLQKYGVADIAAAIRVSQPLRFPFLSTTDPVAGMSLLVQAICASRQPRTKR